MGGEVGREGKEFGGENILYEKNYIFSKKK